MAQPTPTETTLEHLHRLTKDRSPIAAADHVLFQPLVEEDEIDGGVLVAHRYRITTDFIKKGVTRILALETITPTGQELLREAAYGELLGHIAISMIPLENEITSGTSYIETLFSINPGPDLHLGLFTSSPPIQESLREAAEEEFLKWGVTTATFDAPDLALTALAIPDIEHRVSGQLAQLA